jgi:hypothetical protein
MLASFLPRRLLAAPLAALVLICCSAFAAETANAAYVVPGFGLTATPEQAAGHPGLAISLDPDAAKADATGGDDLKDITIDAPAGMMIDQRAATTKCSSAQLSADTCPAASFVGTIQIGWRRTNGQSVAGPGSVYVMTTPTTANTASLGFVLRPSGHRKLNLRATVSNAIPLTQPTRVSATSIPRTITTTSGVPVAVTIDQLDVALNARAGAGQTGPYFTLNPSACSPATTSASIKSWFGVSVTRSSTFTPTGCAGVGLSPAAAVAPTVQTPGAATGVTRTISMPTAEASIQNSAVSVLSTDLPAGTRLNAAGANAVSALCSAGSLAGDICPSGSRIGTAQLTPAAAGAALNGDVYLMSRSATSLGVGYVLRSSALGVKLRLTASLADADTDGDGANDRVRLLAGGLPQVPWSSASLNISAPLLLNAPAGCPKAASKSTVSGFSGGSATVATPWPAPPIDCTPDSSISSGPSGPVASPAAQFEFSSTIAGSDFECRLDDGSWGSCGSPAVLTDLADGPHRFCVRAVSDGIADPTPACRDFSVDTVAPTVGVSCRFANGGMDCDWTVNEPASVVCMADAWHDPCPNPVRMEGPGAHSIVVTATDAAGNRGSAALYFDAFPVFPEVTIAHPDDDSWIAADNTTLVFLVNGMQQIPHDTSCTAAGLPTTENVVDVPLDAGENTLTVTCSNAAGTDSRQVTVHSDTQPPAIGPITVTHGPVSPQPPPLRVDGTVSFSATDDSGLPPTCWPESGSRVTLQVGVNTVTVDCVDAAGNGATRSVTVNVAPPPPLDVAITGGPSGVTPDPVSTFSYAASEPLAAPNPCEPGVICIQVIVEKVTLSCRLDSGASFACPTDTQFGGSWTTPWLQNGPHTFCVTATRLADGQAAGDCRSFTVAYEPPPPPPVSCSVTGDSATCSWSADPRVSWTTTCDLDGGGASACSSPATFSGLSQGNHSLAVCFTDPAANVACRQTALRIPGPPPVVTITSPADNSYISGTSVPVQFSATTFDGSPTQCDHESPFDAALDEGANTITVVCTDVDGQPGVASVSVVRDTIAPTIANISPSDGAVIVPNSVPLTYTATDANGPPACTPQSGTVIPLELGSTKITITCTDRAGNTAVRSVTVSHDEDADRPLVTISSPQQNFKTQNQTIAVYYSVTPANAVCDFPSGSARSLAVGTNTITVTCHSPSGSVGSASVTGQRANPLTLNPGCSYGQAAATNGPTCFPSASGGFPPYQFTCTLNGMQVSCNSIGTTPLLPGTYTLTICVTDSIGTTVCSYSINFTISPGGPGGGGGGTTCPPGMICIPDCNLGPC